MNELVKSWESEKKKKKKKKKKKGERDVEEWGLADRGSQGQGVHVWLCEEIFFFWNWMDEWRVAEKGKKNL